MKRKSYLLLVSVFLVFGTILAGCGSTKTSSNNQPLQNGNDANSQAIAKKSGKDLVIGVSATFVSMDPQDSNDTLGLSAQKFVLEGLLGFDKSMKIVPVLAESLPTTSSSGTEMTFKLRKNVTFQDGTPFNADAVKQNFDRVTNPANKLKRYSLFSNIQETKVVDDSTVTFVLKQPFGAMANNFAHPAGMILSPKSYAAAAKNPVGTGPFKFDSWDTTGVLKFVKNDNYWGGSPKVDSISFKPVTENGARIAMLQTGQADMIYPVPTESVASINGKNGIDVFTDESIVVQYLSMNVTKKPYDNAKVRQAINYALDKKAFIQTVFNNYAANANSIIAPKVQFYSAQTPYDFNLDKAKQLMKEAGLESGFTAQLWGSNSSTTGKAMEFIQQQLAKINITVKITPMESGVLSDKLWGAKTPADAGVELYYGGWSPSTGEADWGIRPLLASASFPPASYNTAYYKNDQVDQLIDKGKSSADDSVRNDAYKQIQKIIWDDAPWAPLAVTNTIFGKKNYLDGIYLQPDGALGYKDIQIKQ